jgi:hypothetical protein
VLRRPPHALLVATGLSLVAAALTSCATSSEPRPSAPAEGVFGPTSEWRRDVTDAPLHPRSAQLVAGLAQQVEQHYGTAALNVWDYNTSFYSVAPGTERVDVAFDDCQDKGYVPEQLYGDEHGGHFEDVPIPPGAVPAEGTDAQLTVHDPQTDQLWEFWVASEGPDGWSACWGGRIDDVSRSPGFFPDGMGSAATGLATSGGMIRIAEAERGRIDHALSLAVVDAASFEQFSWPAQRSDGHDPEGLPDRLPEGLRLRLDPAVDVDALGLHPLAAAVARAAQQYGFIITDKAGAVSVVTESGAGVEAATGTDPWVELLGGTPAHEVMQGFPWDRMQALPVDHGRP